MANVKELTKLQDFLRTHPDQVNMGVWIRPEDNECGTTACAAGWTCLLNGYEPRRGLGAGRTTTSMITKPRRWFRPLPRINFVDQVAGRILGLTSSEATRLFYSGDDVDRVLSQLIERYSDG